MVGSCRRAPVRAAARLEHNYKVYAVSADGSHGKWAYVVARRPAAIPKLIEGILTTG